MQRYDSYRDSGVEWLGEVPSHWEVKRNIGLFDERKEINRTDMDLLSVTIKPFMAAFEQFGGQDEGRALQTLQFHPPLPSQENPQFIHQRGSRS